MSPYTPTEWVDDDGSGTTGTSITAVRLNNLEGGVRGIHGSAVLQSDGRMMNDRRPSGAAGGVLNGEYPGPGLNSAAASGALSPTLSQFVGVTDPRLSRPPRTDTLPAAAPDGHEIYYVADDAAGKLWHLRFNAGSSKWEVLGQPPPLYATGSGNASFTNTSYADGTSGAPSVTLPQAGDWKFTIGARAGGATDGEHVSLGLHDDGALLADAEISSQVFLAGSETAVSISRVAMASGIGSGSVVDLRYKTDFGLAGKADRLFIEAVPLRIG